MLGVFKVVPINEQKCDLGKQESISRKILCREKEGKGEEGEEVREEVREEGSGFGSGHAAAYELLLRNAIIKLCS